MPGHLNPRKPTVFPTVALLPAFLHGRTGVLPTPLPFEPKQARKNPPEADFFVRMPGLEPGTAEV